MKTHNKQKKHSPRHDSLIPAFFFDEGQDEHRLNAPNFLEHYSNLSKVSRSGRLSTDGKTKVKGDAASKQGDEKGLTKARDNKKAVSMVQRKMESTTHGKVKVEEASKGLYRHSANHDSLIPAFIFDEGQADYNMNAPSSLKHSPEASKGQYRCNANHDRLIPAFFFDEGQDDPNMTAPSSLKHALGPAKISKKGKPSIDVKTTLKGGATLKQRVRKDSSIPKDEKKADSMIQRKTGPSTPGKLEMKEIVSKGSYRHSVHHDNMIPAFFFDEDQDEYCNNAPGSLKHHSNPSKVSKKGQAFSDGKTKLKGSAILKQGAGTDSIKGKDEKKVGSTIQSKAGSPACQKVERKEKASKGKYRPSIHHESLIPAFFDKGHDDHNMNAAKHSSNSSKVSKKEKSSSDGKTKLKGAAALKQRDGKDLNKATDEKKAKLMFQRKRESSTCEKVEMEEVSKGSARNNSRKLKTDVLKIKAIGKDKLLNAEKVMGTAPKRVIRKSTSHAQENKNEIFHKQSSNHGVVEFKGATSKRSDAEHSKKAKGERMKSTKFPIEKSSNHAQLKRKLKGMSTLKGSGKKDSRKETNNIATANISQKGKPSNAREAEVKRRLSKRSEGEYSRKIDDEKNVKPKVSRKGKCFTDGKVKLKGMSSNQSSLRSRTENDKTLELKGKAPKQGDGQGLRNPTHGHAKTEVSWEGKSSKYNKVTLKGTASEQRDTKESRKVQEVTATTRGLGKGIMSSNGKAVVTDLRQDSKIAISKAQMKHRKDEDKTSWEVKRSFQTTEEGEYDDEEEEDIETDVYSDEEENEYEDEIDEYEDEYCMGQSWEHKRLMQAKKYEEEEEEEEEEDGGEREREYDDNVEDEEEEDEEEEDEEEGGSEDEEDEYFTKQSWEVGRFVQKKTEEYDDEEAYEEDEEEDDNNDDMEEEENEEEGNGEEYDDKDEELEEREWEEEEDDEGDNDEDEGIPWASRKVGQYKEEDEDEDEYEFDEEDNEEDEDEYEDEEDNEHYKDEDDEEYDEEDNDEGYGDDDDDDEEGEEYADEERQVLEKYDDDDYYEEKEEGYDEEEDDEEDEENKEYEDEEGEYGDEEENEEYEDEVDEETEYGDEEENEEYGDEVDEEAGEYGDKEENEEYGGEENEEYEDEEENEEFEDEDEEENEEYENDEQNEEFEDEDEEENEEYENEEENEEYEDEEENEEDENEEYEDEEENEEDEDEENENEEYGDEEEEEEEEEDQNEDDYEDEYEDEGQYR